MNDLSMLMTRTFDQLHGIEDLGPVWIFFFITHHSLLNFRHSSFITHHLKYSNSLHKVCLAPSLNLSLLKYFYYFVGPMPNSLIAPNKSLSLSLSLSLVFSALGCMETFLHPLRPTKTSLTTPPFGLATPRWLR